MAAKYILAFMLLAITLLEGGFCVTDEEFQVGYLVL